MLADGHWTNLALWVLLYLFGVSVQLYWENHCLCFLAVVCIILFTHPFCPFIEKQLIKKWNYNSTCRLSPLCVCVCLWVNRGCMCTLTIIEPFFILCVVSPACYYFDVASMWNCSCRFKTTWTGNLVVWKRRKRCMKNYLNRSKLGAEHVVFTPNEGVFTKQHVHTCKRVCLSLSGDLFSWCRL